MWEMQKPFRNMKQPEETGMQKRQQKFMKY